MISDPFAMYDGAYVMGALSDTERRAFEAHLAECDECAAAVDELRDLPAMLATVPESVLADETPPLTLLPALQQRARRQVRRRRWIVGGIATAAAACVIAVSIVLTLPSAGPAAHPVAMSAVANSPVTATADVRAVTWGTRIALVCRYNEATDPTRAYALTVIDRAGQRHQLGTWKLVPGKITRYESGISLDRAQIKEVEITTVGGKPLLALAL